MRRTLTGLATLVVLAGGLPAAARAATIAGVSGISSWVIQAVPLPPGATNGYLPSVSCPSAVSCIAVGSRFQHTGPLNQLRGAALAEHWNGSVWRLQSVPVPAGAGRFVNLSGVWCSSAASCTAVGNYQDSAGNYHTLAEHWDGRIWSVQLTPTPPAVAFVSLYGVWCASAASCVAVGYYATGVTSGPGAALVERWDGSTWTIEPTPANPPGSYVSILNAVSCTAAASCTAVGASYSTSSPTVQTLAERWNGSRWEVQPTPRLSGALTDGLIGVSCTSADQCTAVGAYYDHPDSGLALAERWNGSTWTIQPTPTLPGPTGQGAGLYAVSCTSADQCTAVGGSANAALAERWNGSTWTAQPTASPRGQKLLYAVSCTAASTCTAVGGSAAGSDYTNDQPLAEHE